MLHPPMKTGREWQRVRAGYGAKPPSCTYPDTMEGWRVLAEDNPLATAGRADLRAYDWHRKTSQEIPAAIC